MLSSIPPVVSAATIESAAVVVAGANHDSKAGAIVIRIGRIAVGVGIRIRWPAIVRIRRSSTIRRGPSLHRRPLRLLLLLILIGIHTAEGLRRAVRGNAD